MCEYAQLYDCAGSTLQSSACVCFARPRRCVELVPGLRLPRQAKLVLKAHFEGFYSALLDAFDSVHSLLMV